MLPVKFHHALVFTYLAVRLVFGLFWIACFSVWRLYFWWGCARGRGAEMQAIADRLLFNWAALLLRRYDCEVQVEGLEHMPARGPVIVVANHQSLFDIPIFMTHLGRMLGFVAKRELFRIPGFSYWMKMLHCISLDRADTRGVAAMFESLSREIKETGSGIIVFPEGTRTRDKGGAIQKFREGSLRLATAQGIPILPISIDGSRYFSRPEALYHTRKTGRVVRVKIAPLVHYKADSSRERRDLASKIRDIIVANHESIRVEWPAKSADARSRERTPAT